MKLYELGDKPFAETFQGTCRICGTVWKASYTDLAGEIIEGLDSKGKVTEKAIKDCGHCGRHKAVILVPLIEEDSS